MADADPNPKPGSSELPNQTTPSPGAVRLGSPVGKTIEVPSRRLRMNEDRLIRLMERMQRQEARQRPQPDWAVTFLLEGITLVLVRVSADFSRAFLLSANTLQDFTVFLAIGFLVAAVYLFVQWQRRLNTFNRFPVETAEQMVAAVWREANEVGAATGEGGPDVTR